MVYDTKQMSERYTTTCAKCKGVHFLSEVYDHKFEPRRNDPTLVNDLIESANFWHEAYINLAKRVMLSANLPLDFKTNGLNDAFRIITDAVTVKR